MRISDWSSDVCSSDLLAGFADAFNKPAGRCVDCHTEHEGAGPMPATPQRFCADCPDGMADRLESAGLKATVADAADVGTGHPEFRPLVRAAPRSEEHTSELPSLMRTQYAVFCLSKK